MQCTADSLLGDFAAGPIGPFKRTSTTTPLTTQAGEVFERGSLGHGECLAVGLELYDEHENKMSTRVSTQEC